MKKVVLFIVSAVISSMVMSQEVPNQVSIVSPPSINFSKKNELKFNIGTAIFGFPEISYERFLSNNEGVGLSVAYMIENYTGVRSEISPYYRVYFSKKPNSGFFIEASTALIGSSNPLLIYDSSNNEQIIEYKTVTYHLGFAAAAGVKLLTIGNIVGEIYLGYGRYFNAPYFNATYPKCGLVLAKRF